MNKKIIIAFMMMLVLSTIPIFLNQPVKAAGPYYVATTGSDTTGTGTLANPYLTLRKAINASGNSDTIYMRGGKYTLASSMTGGVYINRSGTVAQPFTIATYPSDLTAGNRAIIDGRLVTLIANCGLFTFNRFSTYYHNITINGLSIENSSSTGFYIPGYTDGRPCKNIIINNSNFRNMSHAIYAIQLNIATRGYIENVTVSYCTFWRICAKVPTYSGEGITFIGVKNFVFEYNTILWSRYIGVEVSGGCCYGRINNNNLHVNESSSTRVTMGIYIEPCDNNNRHVDNIDIYNNVIWGTVSYSANAIGFNTEYAGDYIDNVSIYNNIINISAIGSYSMCGIKIMEAVTGYVHNVTIKYNTIYTKNGVSSHAIYITSVDNLRDIIIANNILLSGGTSIYQIKVDGFTNSTSFILRYNNLYNKTNGPTWMGYYLTTGGNCSETTKIKASPQCVAMATGNFRLNSTSPAINAASSAYIIAFDINGTFRPQSLLYDIGAYEYHPTSTPIGDLIETTQVISHGLGTTPDFIAVTPTSYPGSYVFFYVDTITATTFTLHMLTEEGVTISFMWKAEKI